MHFDPFKLYLNRAMAYSNKKKNLCQGDWKAKMRVGHSIELKGGSHQPHQCSINGMEWV